MYLKKVKLIKHDCLPILMLLYVMLYIVLAYLMLFSALSNSNARVGRNSLARKRVLGRHGVGKCNDNGCLLL